MRVLEPTGSVEETAEGWKRTVKEGLNDRPNSTVIVEYPFLSRFQEAMGVSLVVEEEKKRPRILSTVTPRPTRITSEEESEEG